MHKRSGTITGVCSHWLRLLLCAFLLIQGGPAAAEPADCSDHAFSATGQGDAPFDGKPAPAALESETQESLEDLFSSLATHSPAYLDRGSLHRSGLVRDSLDLAHLRKGHLTRAPPLLFVLYPDRP